MTETVKVGESYMPFVLFSNKYGIKGKIKFEDGYLIKRFGETGILYKKGLEKVLGVENNDGTIKIIARFDSAKMQRAEIISIGKIYSDFADNIGLERSA